MKFKAASLVELHAFVGVCKAGTMRQAADALCVTQGAVSRAVLRLERRVGHALFERSAQGVVPNARARSLLARVEPSLIELERAFMDISRTPAQRHSLRLSVVPTLGTHWLVPRLAAFTAVHPGIDVELRPFHHDEDFRRDDVDVWIDVKRPNRRWPRGISARYLLGREITPVCTPGIRARLETPASLLKESLLHHANFPDNWRLWLSAAGVATARLKLGNGFDVGNNLIVAACAGMGVAAIQPCLVARELAAGELVRPFALSVSTGRGYYLCIRKAADGKSSVEAFVRWIVEEAKSETT